MTCGLLLGSGSFDFFGVRRGEAWRAREGRRREREESEERVASDLDYPGCRIENPIRFHPTPQIGFQPPIRAARFPHTDRLWGFSFLSDFSGAPIGSG